MIVALIFAAIIAISLSTYLRLAITATRMANRSYYFNAAQDVADTGLEHTLWSLNNGKTYASPTNWTTGGFTDLGGNLYRGTFPTDAPYYYTLSGGATAVVKVYVDNTTSTPHVLARAIITLGDKTTLSKTVEAYMEQRSWSKGGMISRNGIDFNGNVMIDSWISYDDDGNAGNDQRYIKTGASANRRAEAHIASPSLITVQNADVYGYVAIGADSVTSSSLTVGPSGRIAATLTAGTGIDYSRLTYDFTASFPDVSPVPTNSGSTAGVALNLSNVTADTYLPRIDTTTGAILDSMASDGNYYYYTSSLVTNGNVTIRIGPPLTGPGSTNPSAKVIVVVPGDITLTGTSQIVIDPLSKLTVYSGGDIDIQGNTGIQNGGDTAATMNMPSYFTLLGTRTALAAASSTMQDWRIQGGAYLSGRIVGPNANIRVGGTGDTYGSIIGNEVHMVGSGDFHQDESLGNIKDTGLWQLTKWREITSASELNSAAVATPLSF